MDYRIELIALPVSDLDRSRTFYGDTLGWSVDHDREVEEQDILVTFHGHQRLAAAVVERQ